MNILIIGSEGFIGSHCVEHYSSRKDSVFGLDLYEQPSRKYAYTKISRLSPEFDEVLKGRLFDVVINAAGSGNVPYSMTHPVSDFEANCFDTIRLLDAIYKNQPECRYLHLSSAAVYGNPSSLPIKEEGALSPLSPYGSHKSIAELLCREYTSLFQVRTAIVRPFSVYGSGLKKQLFWDLYQKSLNATGDIELFGTGKESRDYIHIRDLVRGIACVLDKGELKGEVYNLASGVETKIEEAVGIFFNAIQVKQKYYFNGKVREGDPLNWRADTGKIGQLGFSCKYDLHSGLEELANWIRTLNS
ncbi:NAD-dependent epimerase/dehydratase family protein [Flavitalea flava]